MSMFENFWQWMKRMYATLLMFLATPLIKVSRYFLGIANKLMPVVSVEPVVEPMIEPMIEVAPISVDDDFLANAFKTVDQVPETKSLQEQLEDYFTMKADSCSPAIIKTIDKYLKDKHGHTEGGHPYILRMREHGKAMAALLDKGERVGILKRVLPKQYSLDSLSNISGFHLDVAAEGSVETNAFMTEMTGMDQPFPTPYDIKYFEPSDDSASIKMHESMKKRLASIDAKLRDAKKLPKGWGRNSVIVASDQMHIDALLEERERARAEKAKKPMESIDTTLRDAKNLPKNLRTHAARNALIVEEKTKKSKPKTEQKAKSKTKKAARSTNKKTK